MGRAKYKARKITILLYEHSTANGYPFFRTPKLPTPRMGKEAL